MFCFINLQNEGRTKTPAIADGIGFVLLADSSYLADYALFECDLPYNFQNTEQIQRVSEQLADLLESAKKFPPALALLRDEVSGTEPLPKHTFTTILIERLSWHLESQRKQPFFMAKAAATEPSYKDSGRYYWIVDFRPHSPGQEIGWVSDDYHIYHDPIEHFDITAAELEKRFLQKPADS